LIASVVLLHLMLSLAVMRNHHEATSASGPPMFGPVVSQVWRDIRQHPMTSREWTTEVSLNNLSAPAQRWLFPPIDIWPSLHQPTELTDFTPVTAAEPVESETARAKKNRTSPQRSRDERTKLRMTRWSRPRYSAQQALDGQKGAVSIELEIDETGTVNHASLVESSGFNELDRATLQVAHTWRFAPPVWNGAPVPVRARIQIRYN
jgi:TonB family protein